jgi:peptidoglycan/LPS O-acetylase OafA/YrhL
VPSEPSQSELTSRRGASLGHVRALDGVRALAVSGVVLYHGGVSVLRGGFLGVDVFFVLSGFLITSLLVTEFERRGRLSLARFYERRARRLLPALVLLIGLVAAYASVGVPHGSIPSLPGQIVGTMAYVGNWTLISGHATYFTLGLPPSPLQHTWSLAIEEQFYLVWPALLLGLWRLTKRRGTLATVCCAGAAACAAVTAAQYLSNASVDTLYFATQTHAVTMLLGAALSFLLLTRVGEGGDASFRAASPRRQPLANALGAAAWLGVIATFLVVSGTGATLYVGGYLGFGVLVAVALAATLTAPDGWSARALSLGPIVFLGQISYGVYLFHFPLFLWIDESATGLSGVALLVVRLVATLLVATLSFYVVERPIRERRFLRGARGLAAGAVTYGAAAAVAFSVTTAAASVPFADRIARWNFVPTAPAGTTATYLIVGDSMAQTLGFGLNNLYTTAAHVFITVDGEAKGCSLVGGTMRVKDFLVPTTGRCGTSGAKGWPTRWPQLVRRVQPRAVMVLFRLDTVDHRLSGRWVHVGDPGFDCVLSSRLVRAAAALSATGRPVIFLTSPYFSTGEQANGSGWPEDTPSRVDDYNALLARVAAQFPGVVHVVDLNRIVSPGGHYARTIGSTVVRWVDGVHFTYAGDAYVLPRLLPAIEQLGRGAAPSIAALAALDAAAHSHAQSGACAAGRGGGTPVG